MKVLCKKTYRSNDYNREFTKGIYYELDPDENFEKSHNGTSVFVLMNEGFDHNGRVGIRFTLKSLKQGNCEPFYEYFTIKDIKKARKEKLEKIMKK